MNRVYSMLIKYRPWFDIGIDGSDEVLSVSDSGIDVDNCYFQSDSLFTQDGTIDMSQRKVVQYIPHLRSGDIYDALWKTKSAV